MILAKRKLNDIEYLNFTISQPYNLAVTLKLTGKITKEELRNALKKAQDKHHLLKSRMWISLFKVILFLEMKFVMPFVLQI